MKNKKEMTQAYMDSLPTDELEKILAARKNSDIAKAKAKQAQYEKDREELINSLGQSALDTFQGLRLIKQSSFEQLGKFRTRMLEYGDIRMGDKNKGSFEIKNDKFKIQFASQIRKQFDERSELAEEKLKKFLKSFVKKRDEKLFNLILGLLERNTITGDLDISNINRLYKFENQFDNADWKESIKLFKESYNPASTAQYIRFYKKNTNGKWDLINLNFASI